MYCTTSCVIFTNVSVYKGLSSVYLLSMNGHSDDGQIEEVVRKGGVACSIHTSYLSRYGAWA